MQNCLTFLYYIGYNEILKLLIKFLYLCLTHAQRCRCLASQVQVRVRVRVRVKRELPTTAQPRYLI